MNATRRFTAVVAVTVSTGLALAGIVLGAALVTDAVSYGNSGGNFSDRMARIMGTNGIDASSDDAWGTEERQTESESSGGVLSIPVYEDGFTMDCSVDLDAKHSFSDDVFIVRCPDSVIYMEGGSDEFNLTPGMFLEIRSDSDFDQ